MADITTFDLLHALPLGEEFKEELLAKFDTLSPDSQDAIEDIIWDTYDALCKLRLEQNLAQAHQQAAHKQMKLNDHFYSHVKAKTEEELLTQLQKSVTEEDLSDTREALEKIINQAN